MTRLLDVLKQRSLREPDGVAIESNESPLTWSLLPPRIVELAEELWTLLPKGGACAVALDQGPAACLVDLALLEAGIPTVPLPPFFTADQRSHALRSSGCAAILQGEAGEGRLALKTLPGVFLETLDHAPAALPAGTAKVSFTSGSTGTPQGICLAADHLIDVAQSVVDRLGPRHAGRHLPVLPPSILLENVAGFYASLLAGGTYVALPQADLGFANPFFPELARLVAAAERHRITSLILVPEYLGGLTALLEAGGRRLPGLTLVAVGGARVSPALLERARAIGLPARQGYGLTECGSVVSLEAEGEAVRGSVGTSLGRTVIRLAEDGEIVIDGPVCLGTTDGARAPAAFHTGDIGRMDEAGRLWIEGRKSNLIVTSFGRNVSPEWVEALLVDRPEVLQAMVRGDDKAALEALIVPAAPDADVAGAVDAANRLLPPYARVAEWQIVPPFLPASGMLTTNGRLRRAAIDAAYPARSAAMPFFERLVAETREAQARFAAVPQLQAGLTGRISRADYIAYLTQAYYHVRHTVPLMKEARAGLAQRPQLVAALDEYILEETGHEAWILDDIAAAGGDRSAVEHGRPSPATAAMVDHAYRTIRAGNPAAFFGMVYVLEGTSIAMATAGASAVQAALGLPADAFRYLTSHGALDQDHMRFFERLMNRIDDPGDQAAIVAMARDMFGLFGGLFASIELEARRAAA